MTPSDRYESPLTSRYASDQMSELFSPRTKYRTWRKLWLALAKGEQKQGLPITDTQIQELEAHLDTIDLSAVAAFEKETRHDVMAHILAFGEQCPTAKGVLHLGATSTYVTDNTDLILIKDGIEILLSKLVQVMDVLATFAKEFASTPCLGWTHFQPAQPTTLGKRACLWLQDLLTDYKELLAFQESLRFLGVKGATGTQASFLSLFDGDQDKVNALEQDVASAFGFKTCYTIASQTYPRKEETRLLHRLSSLGTSIHKFGTDIRLLAHLNEVEEPFGTKQVGSSAMPFKRNPMRSERLCALSRALIALSHNSEQTAASQWLERSLDDSANRRLVIPEAFLIADSLLNLLHHVASGLTVFPKVIEAHLKRELPYLALETLLMQAVKQGKDRQVTHELLKTLAHKAKQTEKETGAPQDLVSALKASKELGLPARDIDNALSPNNFIGAAPAQVAHFLTTELHLETHTPAPIPTQAI